MKRPPHYVIPFWIGLLIILQALGYTVFQWFQHSRDEAMIQNIYRRHLESLIFSVNQHNWNTLHEWSEDVVKQMKTGQSADETEMPPAILRACHIQISDTTTVFEPVVTTSRLTESDWRTVCSQGKIYLQSHEKDLRQTHRRMLEGYSQFETLTINLSEYGHAALLLLPIEMKASVDSSLHFIGMIINIHAYVNNIILPKFQELNREQMDFAVQNNNGDFLYTSTEDISSDFEVRSHLWVLDDLSLLIRFQGTTLQDLSKKRIRMQLAYLILMNTVLIAGIVILLINVNKAMALTRMKSDFVANVSHELRTPLALIRMYAETLEMGRISSKEKTQKYYRTIMSECSRLTQLINNILDFSKIESETKSYSFESVRPEEWLDSVLETYQFHLSQNGFELQVNVQPEMPEIQADSGSMTRAFLNLMDNAVKFSSDRREIQVDVEHQNGYVVLSVRDFGIGIAGSEQSKIFDKFYRTGSSLIHNTKGTGLGLSLVKHIMEKHQGKVTVESKPGQGSRFSLWFPILLKGDNNGTHTHR